MNAEYSYYKNMRKYIFAFNFISKHSPICYDIHKTVIIYILIDLVIFYIHNQFHSFFPRVPKIALRIKILFQWLCEPFTTQMNEYQTFGSLDPFEIVSIFTHQLIRYKFHSFPLFSKLNADILVLGSRTFTTIKASRYASLIALHRRNSDHSWIVYSDECIECVFCLRFACGV